jgi:hypothetical protein
MRSKRSPGPARAWDELHLNVEALVCDDPEVQAFVQSYGRVGFKDMKANGSPGLRRFPKEVPEQPCSDAGSAVLGEQGNVNDSYLLTGAVDQYATTRLSVSENNPVVGIGKLSSVRPVLCGELLFEERLTLLSAPTPGVKFLPADVGVQSEQKSLIVRSCEP